MSLLRLRGKGDFGLPVLRFPPYRAFKAGTQQVEELIKKEFPQAGVLRMDLDTTREKESYEKILSAFADQEADILVGTQMIVKGHDFPNVTLVGVLAADLSLYMSDFRAAERTFALLCQAAGRAGRGSVPGEQSSRAIIRSITVFRQPQDRTTSLL